jgi:hypothetical protein
MMTPVHNAWSVVAGPVYDEPPAPPLSPTRRDELRAELATARAAGQPVRLDVALVLALIDAAEPGPAVDYEARIEDHERSVVYRARVDSRGDLTRLAVEVEGAWIDDNVLRRVPVARIRRVALNKIAEAQSLGADAFILTFAGDLSERPSLDVIADLMAAGRTRGEIHAIYPNVPLPTIGRWMAQVRKHEAAPAAQQTTDDD